MRPAVVRLMDGRLQWPRAVAAARHRFFSSASASMVGTLSFPSPKSMMQDMSARTSEEETGGSSLVRNYFGRVECMSAENLVVESELFPRDALEYYTGKNLELLDETDHAGHRRLADKFFNPMRGGGQGDYSLGIQEKIANVEDCLRRFPSSKRAALTLPFSSCTSVQADHTLDDEAKCLRELHFYLETVDPAGRSPALPWSKLLPALELPTSEAPSNRTVDASRVLSCTGIMRANAAIIFPKNIHFIGAVMHELAWRLGADVGTYSHFVTHLVSDRS